MWQFWFSPQRSKQCDSQPHLLARHTETDLDDSLPRFPRSCLPIKENVQILQVDEGKAEGGTLMCHECHVWLLHSQLFMVIFHIHSPESFLVCLKGVKFRLRRPWSNNKWPVVFFESLNSPRHAVCQTDRRPAGWKEKLHSQERVTVKKKQKSESILFIPDVPMVCEWQFSYPIVAAFSFFYVPYLTNICHWGTNFWLISTGLVFTVYESLKKFRHFIYMAGLLH